MNKPSTVGKNWRWRLKPGQLTQELSEELLALAKRYGRTNWDALHVLEAEEKAKQEKAE